MAADSPLLVRDLQHSQMRAHGTSIVAVFCPFSYSAVTYISVTKHGVTRAGKSYLLRRFLQGRAGFYYQATKTTARKQFRALGRWPRRNLRKAVWGMAAARELRGIRQVHLAMFTSSPTIIDLKLAEQIKQGEVLHLSAEELLRSN